MRKMNKKGFTIVELVIVIAVIAILAAVLIPTFSGIVEKANNSAVTQETRAAVTTLLAETDGQIPANTYIVYEKQGTNGEKWFKYADGTLTAMSDTEKANVSVSATSTIYTSNTETTKVEGVDVTTEKPDILPTVTDNGTPAKTTTVKLLSDLSKNVEILVK